jgi:hypothetical protein
MLRELAKHWGYGVIPNAKTKLACGVLLMDSQVLCSERTGAIPEKGFQEERGPAENAHPWIGCLDTGQADRLLREAGMQNFQGIRAFPPPPADSMMGETCTCACTAEFGDERQLPMSAGPSKTDTPEDSGSLFFRLSSHRCPLHCCCYLFL